MPQVFVGVPTYRRPELVKETVHSVLAQTYRDFRLVISDNRSGEAIEESLRNWVRSLADDRVSFIVQPENEGEYGQGRSFFRESSEPYFVILHDDDLIEPTYLERAIGVLDAHRDLSLFVANPYVFGQDGTVSEEGTSAYHAQHGRVGREEGPFEILSTLFGGGFPPISGTVIRRERLVASGFVEPDGSGNFPFELNVMVRLGALNDRGWLTTNRLIGFRFHDGALRSNLATSDIERIRGNMIRILERHRFDGDPELIRRAMLCRLHRATAVDELRARRGRSARSHARRAVLTRPQSPKAWAVLFLVALPFRMGIPALGVFAEPGIPGVWTPPTQPTEP